MYIDNLLERDNALLLKVYDNIKEQSTPVTQILYKECGYEHCGNFPKIEEMSLFGKDSFWGGKKQAHAWFYKQIVVPECDNNHRFEINVDFSFEKYALQLLFYLDGKAVKGGDCEHTSMRLHKGVNDVFIYAYAGMLNDKKMPFTATLDYINIEAETLYYNLSTPLLSLESFDKKSVDYYKILQTTNQAFNMLCFDTDKYYSSVSKANVYIVQNLYNDKTVCTGKKSPVVSCFGHSHIDIAWRWPFKQTMEKIIRSFGMVLYNMERYPQFTFMASQPVIYYMLKKECPEMYSAVKQKIEEGKWVPEGCMWCESDCNIPSGESLVRQIIFGRKFFRQEFGVDNSVLWLPDSFGYTASLPQIMNKSGIELFVTSKISWNDTNTFPYDTFSWKGIDGSKTLGYILTAQQYSKTDDVRYTVYSSLGTPEYVKGTYERYQQKYLNDNVMMAFGYGDGGGGPTELDIEYITRLENGMGEIPATEITTVSKYKDFILDKVKGNVRLPVIDDELYLEFHRGTLTNAANSKRYNRLSEFALNNVETVSALAEKFYGVEYPLAMLDKVWKIVLSNQFHDIVTGSSIKEVYEQSYEEYKYVLNTLNEYFTGVFDTLSQNFGGEGFLLFNGNDTLSVCDVVIDGKTYEFGNVQGKSIGVYTPMSFDNSVTVHDNVLENNFYKLTFNEDWLIQDIYDKMNGRHILKNNQFGNDLRVYDDNPPMNFDAWDVREYYTEKYSRFIHVESIETFNNGAKSGLRIKRKFNNSTLCQDIVLYEHSDRIDFVSKLDWHEKHKLLKVCFPVDINSHTENFDIQYGIIERDIRSINSFQKAKFEVCGQKFADISEGNYGVALMNDCKYGYTCNGNDLELSLLRASTYPNEDSDIGEHTFTYSLYAHSGNVYNSNVYSMAYALNNKPFCKPVCAKNGAKSVSFIESDNSAIVIDCIKKAEDGNGYIVRCFEKNNSHTKVGLTLNSIFKTASLCDLSENEIDKLSIADGKITVDFKPFEIITIKLI